MGLGWLSPVMTMLRAPTVLIMLFTGRSFMYNSKCWKLPKKVSFLPFEKWKWPKIHILETGCFALPRLAVAEGDLCILVSSRRTEKKHKGEENGKRIEGEAMLAAFTRFFFKESLTPKTLHTESTFFYSQGLHTYKLLYLGNGTSDHRNEKFQKTDPPKVPPKTWENSPQKPLLPTRKWFFGHCYVRIVR